MLRCLNAGNLRKSKAARRLGKIPREANDRTLGEWPEGMKEYGLLELIAKSKKKRIFTAAKRLGQTQREATAARYEG